MRSLHHCLEIFFWGFVYLELVSEGGTIPFSPNFIDIYGLIAEDDVVIISHIIIILFTFKSYLTIQPPTRKFLAVSPIHRGWTFCSQSVSLSNPGASWAFVKYSSFNSQFWLSFVYWIKPYLSFHSQKLQNFSMWLINFGLFCLFYVKFSIRLSDLISLSEVFH